MNQLVNISIMEAKFAQVVELFFEEQFKITTMKFSIVQRPKTVPSTFRHVKDANTAGFKNVSMQE